MDSGKPESKRENGILYDTAVFASNETFLLHPFGSLRPIGRATLRRDILYHVCATESHSGISFRVGTRTSWATEGADIPVAWLCPAQFCVYGCVFLHDRDVNHAPTHKWKAYPHFVVRDILPIQRSEKIQKRP